MTDDQIKRVTMPKWGLSMESGRLIEWLVSEGDEIEKGQDVAEIDTDKIVAVLESTCSGVVRALVVEVDVDVPSISYAVLGDTESEATPVVFVHGYGGDKNSWLFVQEPISADRATYALDLPGHGDSSKDGGDGSVATLASG